MSAQMERDIRTLVRLEIARERRWYLINTLMAWVVFIALMGLILFSLVYYVNNWQKVHSYDYKLAFTVMIDKVTGGYDDLEESINKGQIISFKSDVEMTVSEGRTVTLEPVGPEYDFSTTGRDKASKRLKTSIIYKLGLNVNQVKIANDIYKACREERLTPYQTNMVLALGWSESRFRNIGEGKSASASKRKTGGTGKGVFQWTDPSVINYYKVSNPWDVKQSAKKAHIYLMDIRNHWIKKGVKEGTPYLTKLTWAGYNAGTGRAATGLKHFRTTKEHSVRAMNFYRLLTTS